MCCRLPQKARTRSNLVEGGHALGRRTSQQGDERCDHGANPIGPAAPVVVPSTNHISISFPPSTMILSSLPVCPPVPSQCVTGSLHPSLFKRRSQIRLGILEEAS